MARFTKYLTRKYADRVRCKAIRRDRWAKLMQDC